MDRRDPDEMTKQEMIDEINRILRGGLIQKANQFLDQHYTYQSDLKTKLQKSLAEIEEITITGWPDLDISGSPNPSLHAAIYQAAEYTPAYASIADFEHHASLPLNYRDGPDLREIVTDTAPAFMQYERLAALSLEDRIIAVDGNVVRVKFGGPA